MLLNQLIKFPSVVEEFLTDNSQNQELFLNSFKKSLDHWSKQQCASVLFDILLKHERFFCEPGYLQNCIHLLKKVYQQIVEKHPTVLFKIIETHIKLNRVVDLIDFFIKKYCLSINGVVKKQEVNFFTELLINYIDFLNTTNIKIKECHMIDFVFAFNLTDTNYDKMATQAISSIQDKNIALTIDLIAYDLIGEINCSCNKKQKIREYFIDFPEEERWRLFMDRNQQQEGWQSYEKREPGCLAALNQAWDYIERTIDRPLDRSLLLAVHKIANQHHKSIVYPGKIFNEKLHGFNVTIDEISVKGFKELMDRRDLNIICNDKISGTRFCYATTENEGEIEKNIDKLLSNYNVSIQPEITPIDKLKIILRVFNELEIMHPFLDGNCRTFFTLLLNRELIINGFPFAVFADPNHLDFYSEQERLFCIVDGWNNFKIIKNKTYVPGFKSTEELLSEGLQLPISHPGNKKQMMLEQLNNDESNSTDDTSGFFIQVLSCVDTLFNPWRCCCKMQKVREDSIEMIAQPFIDPVGIISIHQLI